MRIVNSISSAKWSLVATTSMAVVAISVGVIGIATKRPEFLQFSWNWYAVLSGLQVLTALILLITLSLRRGSYHGRVWFSICIVGLMMLGMGEMLERLSTSPSQALFWSQLGIVGLAFMPIGFYMFIHYFVSEKMGRIETVTPAVVLFSSGVLLVFVLGGADLALIQKSHGPWGYGQALSVLFLVSALWVSFVVFLSLLKCILLYKSSVNKNHKSQALIIIISTVGALTGGIVLDVVPRFLGLHFVPVGVLFQICMPIGIIYAIYKYDTFAVDMSSLAYDIFDSLSEVMIITDANYKIHIANAFAYTAGKYEPGSLLDMPVTKILSQTDQATILSSIKKQLAHGDRATIADTILVDRYGQSTAVNLYVTRLGGSIPTYVFTFADITRLKKYFSLEQRRNIELRAANKKYQDQHEEMLKLLAESRQLSKQLKDEKESVERKVLKRTAEVRAEHSRLEASINSLNVGFIILDKNGAVLTANSAYKKLINYTKQGTELSSLIALIDDGFDVEKLVAQCFKSGKNVTAESVEIADKIVRIFISPVFDSEANNILLGAVILVEDITDEQIMKRSRDEFFSIASHELRTPLTAIRGNTDLILEYYAKEFKDPSLNEMLGDIHESSVRLIAIVNEFLDMSRLEQGKIKFDVKEVDASSLVTAVIREFEAGGMNDKLYIKKVIYDEAQTLVLADQDRLKQVIINLVGNGLKFTEVGGITITLRQQQKRLYIDITDTGRGIPQESRSLLFRKFQQASNNILTRDSTRSTGLGLYISKLMVEGMNGKIYLANTAVGAGTTFTIELPSAG